MAHTETPWTFTGYDVIAQHGDGQRSVVANMSWRGLSNWEVTANGDRIVQCVNACEGIASDAFAELPRGTVAGALDAMRAYVERAKALQAERDALRAALHWATAYVELDTPNGAQDNPTDWPRTLSGDADPVRIAKHCRAALAGKGGAS